MLEIFKLENLGQMICGIDNTLWYPLSYAFGFCLLIYFCYILIDHFVDSPIVCDNSQILFHRYVTIPKFSRVLVPFAHKVLDKCSSDFTQSTSILHQVNIDFSFHFQVTYLFIHACDRIRDSDWTTCTDLDYTSCLSAMSFS